MVKAFGVASNGAAAVNNRLQEVPRVSHRRARRLDLAVEHELGSPARAVEARDRELAALLLLQGLVRSVDEDGVGERHVSAEGDDILDALIAKHELGEKAEVARSDHG
jgi:hypothetical protein